MVCHKHHCRRRRGSVILEAVISVAILATAMVALTKLAQISSALHQESDGRLAAALAAENVMTRLDAVAVDQLSDEIEKAVVAVEEASGCEITPKLVPFEVNGRKAVHVELEVQAAEGLGVTIHRWIAQDASESSASETGEDQSDPAEEESDEA